MHATINLSIFCSLFPAMFLRKHSTVIGIVDGLCWFNCYFKELAGERWFCFSGDQRQRQHGNEDSVVFGHFCIEGFLYSAVVQADKLFRSWVGSNLNSHLMSRDCIRFPLPLTALKLTERVSGINLFLPNTTVLNQT